MLENHSLNRCMYNRFYNFEWQYLVSLVLIKYNQLISFVNNDIPNALIYIPYPRVNCMLKNHSFKSKLHA